jgi:hypothetical protein
MNIDDCDLCHKRASTRSIGQSGHMLAAYVEVWLVILAGHEFQRPMYRFLVAARLAATLEFLAPMSWIRQYSQEL